MYITCKEMHSTEGIIAETETDLCIITQDQTGKLVTDKGGASACAPLVNLVRRLVSVC